MKLKISNSNITCGDKFIGIIKLADVARPGIDRLYNVVKINLCFEIDGV